MNVDVRWFQNNDFPIEIIISVYFFCNINKVFSNFSFHIKNLPDIKTLDSAGKSDYLTFVI